MTPIAPMIGQVFLSVAALGGIALLYGVLRARAPFDPLNRRFLFALRVLMLIFAGRALIILTGVEAFRFVVLLGAALVPLAVLLLSEGLLRRHAPPWAKLIIGIGTALFALLAFWVGDSIDPARLAGLLAFQLIGFAIGGWLVLTRDRTTLSVPENRAVDRLALSLVLLVPLGATDFLIDYLGQPVQVSPVAVLFLCWLAISLARAQTGHGAPLLGFGAALLGAGFAAGAIAIAAGMGWQGALLTLAIIGATMLLVMIYVDTRSLHSDLQSQTLLRHMAQGEGGTATEFLRGLAAHPLVQGAAFIDISAHDDLDSPVLARIFARSPVLRRIDGDHAGAEAEHIAHLFARFGASHFLLVGDAPLRLLALSLPSITAAPRTELELAALQRMAWLMGQADA